jgi:4-amino-4-deoxy-L-arabinose transferase-like glycosyltransferase
MTGDTFDRSERSAFAVLAITAVIMRIALLLRYRFDSDESQHLHVAWGWTAGLVQYRDVFDNHSPLFHIVTAPLLALFGERSNILILMRLPMLALFGMVVWGTYAVASRFWSRRVAMWSALVLAIFPPYALKSIEYRTDNLWTALWMVALVVLTGGPLTVARLFITGLILGAALATSMKTVLLVVTLIVAAAKLLNSTTQ